MAIALISAACAGNEVTGATESSPPATSAPAAENRTAPAMPTADTPATETSAGNPPVGSTPVLVPPSAENPAAQPADPPNRDDATVDARHYQQGSNYYFQSPSGSIMCGITEGPEATGCQMIDVDPTPPAEMQECWNRENTSGGAKVSGTGSEYVCTNQGVYVGAPTDGGDRGGGRVLEYGDVLIVRGVACTSETTGVTCYMGQNGFHVSKEATNLF
ncbi:hypothetical protein [Rhodococcus sp. NPDC058521]|uniref:hypothetical protein n=1 Tax=Rhodococcus sp. NPDC058521 TaxID=3346536 RepID=UPI003656CA0E